MFMCVYIYICLFFYVIRFHCEQKFVNELAHVMVWTLNTQTIISILVEDGRKEYDTKDNSGVGGGDKIRHCQKS